MDQIAHSAGLYTSRDGELRPTFGVKLRHRSFRKAVDVQLAWQDDKPQERVPELGHGIDVLYAAMCLFLYVFQIEQRPVGEVDDKVRVLHTRTLVPVQDLARVHAAKDDKVRRGEHYSKLGVRVGIRAAAE